MRTLFTLFLSLASLLVLTRSLSATTYYVDYETGNDAANGTTTGTPWKHIPGDTRFTGSPLPGAGDTIAPRKGTTYLSSGPITLRQGSVGNPIVYDGGLWGTGANCIMNGNHTGATDCFFDGNTIKSNITIQNFTITQYGGYAADNPIWTGNALTAVDTTTNVITVTREHNFAVGARIGFSHTSTADVYPAPLTGGIGSTKKYYVETVPTATSFTVREVNTSGVSTSVDITGAHSGTIYLWPYITAPLGGSGIIMRAGTGNGVPSGDNILIQNVDFDQIGQWRNTFPMAGANAATGYGVLFQNNNGVSIIDCNFYKVPNPISGAATSTSGPLENILISGCDMSWFHWGIEFRPRADNATLSNIEIRNNELHDYKEFDSGNWAGFGEKPHSDGIFLRSAEYVSTWTGITIHGNRIYVDTPGNTKGATASIYLSQGPSALIYNNVFIQDPNVRGFDVIRGSTGTVTSQVVRIYNNTFINFPALAFSSTKTDVGVFFHVENNLFLRSNSASTSAHWIYQIEAPTFVDLDYNLYYNPQLPLSTQPKAFTITPGGGSINFPAVQALGFEAHGVYGNPLLTKTTGLPSQMDARLLDGSAAIGAGKNLSAYFTTDKDGNARPGSGAWDIGAYQSGFAPPADTTPPTLTSATIDQSGAMMVMVFNEPVQGVNMSHYAISGHTFSGLTGSGTTWACAVSPIAQAGPNLSMDYTSGAGRTRDLSTAENLLASFTGAVVVNNSAADTPDPPLPGRKGRGARGLTLGR